MSLVAFDAQPNTKIDVQLPATLPVNVKDWSHSDCMEWLRYNDLEKMIGDTIFPHHYI